MFEKAPNALSFEFRDLVNNLYSLRDPNQIQQCNNRIQELQRSQYAFSLASDLFTHSTDANGRFFAALTVSIRLNQDSKELNEETLEPILGMILRWFQQAVDESFPTFVLQRVSTTLIAAFAVPQCPWTQVVADTLSIFANPKRGQSLNNTVDDPQGLLARCTDSQIQALLTISKTLVEDVKNRPHDARGDVVYKRAAANVGPFASMLSGLYKTLAAHKDFRDAKHAYSVQIPKAHLQYLKFTKSSAVSDEDARPLFELLLDAINLILCLPRTDRTFEATTNLLEEVFADRSLIIPRDVETRLAVALQSPRAVEYISMEDGIAEEAEVFFNRMVLAFCKRETPEAFISPDSRTARSLTGKTKYEQEMHTQAFRSQIMGTVLSITTCLQHRILEEALVMATVEFWEEFVQDTRDYGLHEEATTFVLDSIPGFCQASTMHEIDEDDEDNYNFHEEAENELREELKVRLRDLLQVCCEEYGLPVFERLLSAADNVWHGKKLQNDVSKRNAELELVLQFLVEIGDSLRFASSENELDAAEDTALTRMFGSSWYLFSIDAGKPAPVSLRKLALRAIGEFNLYFKNHQNELWHVLDVLVQFMSQPTVAASAAVSIREICDHNRRQIAQADKASQMINVCSQYFEYGGAQRDAKGAILSAVASVAEAISDIHQSSEAIQQLITLIRKDRDRRVAVAGDHQPLRGVVSRDTLNFLHAMGKALQGLDDEADVLERKDLEHMKESRKVYWLSENGQNIQNGLLELLHLALNDGNHQNDIVRKACDVIRTGFRESIAGAFVFPSPVIVEFVKSVPAIEDTATDLMKLVSEFISSQLTPEKQNEAKNLVPLVEITMRVMRQQGNPENDPELAAACLGAFEKFNQSQPGAILELPQEALGFLMQFSLQCLDRAELHPKKAGINFWLPLLTATEESFTSQEQVKIEQIWSEAGPLLMIVLVNNMAGKASRGDLDRLSEPFRLLLTKGPRARQWFEHALSTAVLPAERASNQTRKQFFDKVNLLRGSTKTKACVREFWSQCKGTPTEFG